MARFSQNREQAKMNRSVPALYESHPKNRITTPTVSISPWPESAPAVPSRQHVRLPGSAPPRGVEDPRAPCNSARSRRGPTPPPPLQCRGAATDRGSPRQQIAAIRNSSPNAAKVHTIRSASRALERLPVIPAASAGAIGRGQKRAVSGSSTNSPRTSLRPAAANAISTMRDHEAGRPRPLRRQVLRQLPVQSRFESRPSATRIGTSFGRIRKTLCPMTMNAPSRNSHPASHRRRGGISS